MTTVLGYRPPVERSFLTRELDRLYDGIASWTPRTRLERMPRTLWRTEHLGLAYLLPRLARRDAPLLRHPSWPRAAQPLLHTSLGIAAVLQRDFDMDSLVEAIDFHSHPDFAFLAYEGTGALLPASEGHSLAGVMRLLHLLGRIHWPRRRQNPHTLDRFPRDLQPYVAHGYGRGRYFTDSRLPQVLTSLAELPPVLAAAARQGLAMAYLMVNADRAVAILRLALQLPFQTPLLELKQGLQSGLALLRWIAAGAETPGRPLFRLQQLAQA